MAEVAAEYASFPGKVIVFWDEDIAGDPEYAKALFRAIAPSRTWWTLPLNLAYRSRLRAARRVGERTAARGPP